MSDNSLLNTEHFGSVVVTDEQKELARQFLIKYDAQDLFEMLDL